MNLTKFRQIPGKNEFEQDLDLANMRQSVNSLLTIDWEDILKTLIKLQSQKKITSFITHIN